MNWSLLLTRIVITGIILFIGYFFIRKVWTREVDLIAFFENPSKLIPVKEGVYVNPTELDLTTKDWDKAKIFSIRNTKKEKTAYSIWIKIWSGDKRFDFNEFDIKSKNDDPLISENFRGVTANYELLRIDGFDTNEMPCIYLVLYNLGPEKSKEIKIKRIGSKVKDTNAFSVAIKVMKFSDQPEALISKPGASGLTIKPPELMKVKRISVLMSKDNK
jgi:hypothetical protein